MKGARGFLPLRNNFAAMKSKSGHERQRAIFYVLVTIESNYPLEIQIKYNRLLFQPSFRRRTLICMHLHIRRPPLDINNFKVYQRNVIPPVIPDPPSYRNEIFCKVDKSSNPSPCVYMRTSFSVLLGDLPLFLSIFSSFGASPWRERQLQGTVTHREYNSRCPRFPIPVSLIQLFVWRRGRFNFTTSTSEALISCNTRRYMRLRQKKIMRMVLCWISSDWK